jgi:hypothetical protein
MKTVLFGRGDAASSLAAAAPAATGEATGTASSPQAPASVALTPPPAPPASGSGDDGGASGARPEPATAAVPPPPAAPSAPEAPAPAPVAAAPRDEIAYAPAPSRPTPREAAAERREERREAVQEARAARSGPARVAVDVSGDPALTIPAQSLIEERLADAGIDVVDSPRGADVVVRVRAEVIGNQDISFYGQNAVLTTAYLTVRSFAGSRALGPGLREKIDYTPMSAEAKVKQALAPKLDRVVSGAREGR